MRHPPVLPALHALLGSNLQMAAVWADCARSVEGKGGTWAYTKPGQYEDCAVDENKASQDAMIAFVKRNATCSGYMAGDGAKAARQLQPSKGAVAQWPAAWATDTLQVAPQVFDGLSIQPKTDRSWPATATEPAYRQARENLQAAQLAKAGARLAQLLTTLMP